jgi:hypothetical protein
MRRELCIASRIHQRESLPQRSPRKSEQRSPTMNRLHQEKNLFIGNLAGGGTDAKIFGDITRPENGIRHSPYHETRSQKWEKLWKNGSSEKEGTLDDVTVGKLKNRLSRKQGNVERIHSLYAT